MASTKEYFNAFAFSQLVERDLGMSMQIDGVTELEQSQEKHPLFSHLSCSEIDCFLTVSRLIVRHHHQRETGSRKWAFVGHSTEMTVRREEEREREAQSTAVISN